MKLKCMWSVPERSVHFKETTNTKITVWDIIKILLKKTLISVYKTKVIEGLNNSLKVFMSLEFILICFNIFFTKIWIISETVILVFCEVFV